MKTFYSVNALFFFMAFFMCSAIRSQEKSVSTPKPSFTIDLWENGLPNSNGMESQGYDDEKGNFKPCITVYLPKKTSNPTKAVVICPGGGYQRLAMAHEGYDWSPFFNNLGIAVIVLKYRMPYGHPEVPISDAYEAIRLTKTFAKKWNINPDCIGIMGSSAGGHLASAVATHAPAELRPAFQILFYPLITMNEEGNPGGSRERFLGTNSTPELEKLYSNELQVNEATSRAFIALSDDDKMVKPINSVKYYEALQQHAIPASLHIYPSGGHGWSIKESFKYHLEMLMELKSWFGTF
jgi:acetyl esterase/lipase